MIDKEEVVGILASVKAVIVDSHLVYTSGKHGSAYVNKDAVYPHTKKTAALCNMLAEEFKDDGVEVVIAPAVGGVILSQWTAHYLSAITDIEVLGVYADKEPVMAAEPGEVFGVHVGDGFVVKRGYNKLVAGKRVLVVEDVVNTGGSVQKTIAAVRACGGNVIGVGALCNRGGVTAQDLDVPKFVSLMSVTLDAWDEADCPLCKQGVPVNTDVGKGKEFLARKAAFQG